MQAGREFTLKSESEKNFLFLYNPKFIKQLRKLCEKSLPSVRAYVGDGTRV